MSSYNQKAIWEIFIPRHSDKKTIFHIANHRRCQEKIREATGARIIISSRYTQWIAKNGSFFSEEMFPIRVICDHGYVEQILDIVQEHYELSKVYAYEVTSKAWEYDGKEKENKNQE